MTLFSYIKSQLPILDVISNYAKLKKAGSYWKGPCPFHHEKTGSFTVSPHKDIFYCFGCHIGGDVISFIAKIEQCSQLEAAQHLLEQHQIKLPNNLNYELPKSNPNEKKRYFFICQEIATWCHENLKKDLSIQDYLKKRNFNKKIIIDFTIGYFPGGLSCIKSFINTMHKKNILLQELFDANILINGQKINYSPYENRIIFPIKDHLGRFCGFGGRIFKKNDERAKYYNSKENNFFNKGSILFGFDKAKKYIQKEEKAFLVEGYTDCIAMAQHGYLNTVATLGTSCTKEHLKSIARHANYVYVLYDGDQAGKQAIMRLAKLCWESNVELNIVSLPENEDPASFLNKTSNLEEYIKKSQDIFIFFIETIGKNFEKQSLSKKLNSIKQLLDIINTINDNLKQDLLLQKAAKTFNISIEILQKELKKHTKNNHTFKTIAQQPKEINLSLESFEDDKLEKILFFAIINNISLFNENNADFLINYLSPTHSTILKNLKELKNNGKIEFKTFFEKLTNEQQQYVSKLLLTYEEDQELQKFEYLLLQFYKKIWKKISYSIKMQLAEAEQNQNDEKVTKILQKFLQLKQKFVYKNLIK